MLSLILLVFAFVCAAIAAFYTPQPVPYRPHFGWLAVAFGLASVLAGELPKYAR